MSWVVVLCSRVALGAFETGSRGYGFDYELMGRVGETMLGMTSNVWNMPRAFVTSLESDFILEPLPDSSLGENIHRSAETLSMPGLTTGALVCLLPWSV